MAVLTDPVTVEHAGALPSAFLHIKVKADKVGAVQSGESSQAANTIFCPLQQERRTQFPRVQCPTCFIMGNNYP